MTFDNRGAEHRRVRSDALAGERVPSIPETRNAVETAILDECIRVASMVIDKNRAYGNSALEPVRVFSRASADEQLNVRLDDKLSRLARGQAAGEDVELDLMGYLVLKGVQRRFADATL